MHYRILVKGKVQGVFFRKFTEAKANELGILGYVTNLADGSVYCEAECSDDDLLHYFIDWCSEGPPAARVTSVEVEPGPNKGYTRFEIKR